MTLHGLGIGWRPEVSGIIAQLDGLAFCEVIAESVGNEIPPHLGSLGHTNHPVVPVHHINPFHAQALLFVPFKPAVYRCGGLSWHNFFDDAVNLPSPQAK